MRGPYVFSCMPWNWRPRRLLPIEIYTVPALPSVQTMSIEGICSLGLIVSQDIGSPKKGGCVHGSCAFRKSHQRFPAIVSTSCMCLAVMRHAVAVGLSTSRRCARFLHLLSTAAAIPLVCVAFTDYLAPVVLADPIRSCTDDTDLLLM